LYKYCTSTNTAEEDKKKLKLVLDSKGGWPVLDDNWKDSGSKWYNFGEIIRGYITINPKNNTESIMTFDEPHLSYPRKFLIKGLEDEYVKEYYKSMVNDAVVMGASELTAKQQMKEVLQLEIHLANMTVPSEQKRNKTHLYNPMTISDMNKMYPLINWVDLTNTLINNKYLIVNETTVVNVKSPSYLT